MTTKLISEREAALLIGISRPTIRKYRKLGCLKPIQTKHTIPTPPRGKPYKMYLGGG